MPRSISSSCCSDFGEYCKTTRGNFRKAAEHNDFLLAAGAVHRQNARTQRRDHRRMFGEHAEVAFGAGHVDLLHFTREQQLFGRNQFEMKISHCSFNPCACRERNPTPRPMAPPIAVKIAICCTWLLVSGPPPRALSLLRTSMLSGPSLISVDSSGRVM